MKLLNRIWRSNFLIRLRSWEYWPFSVVYIPIFVYWIWLSIRARSLFYFSASNPSIENGGMLGESKMKIFDFIPDHYKPKTLLFPANCDASEILNHLSEHTISYPFICKPDVGERGFMVRKIHDQQELSAYLEQTQAEFLVQEYIDYPLEMGVFYYRYPGEKEGLVSSIVVKEMLTVVGDGHSTLKSLILNLDRAKLQWQVLKKKFNDQLDMVLPEGQTKELVSIGNHSKGTKFLDGNYLINTQLNKTFDSICDHLKGFYFGRFDIRVKSIDDLYHGKIKIMELNGAGSEPAHIYQPGYSIWRAYRSLFHHWKVLFEISRLNHKQGIPYLSLTEGWAEYKKIRASS